MPSPRPFQQKFSKGAKTDNVFIKPKSMVISEDLDRQKKDKMIRWITFFRRNPHLFIANYFGIKLYPYQVLMIWVLQRSNLAYIVASRAAAKTFIIAIWALTRAVLYPGSEVICTSKTIKQGALILEKLEMLRKNYPNVAREIKQILRSANDNIAYLHCGSTIKVVPSTPSARGENFLLSFFKNYIIKFKLEESVVCPESQFEHLA